MFKGAMVATVSFDAEDSDCVVLNNRLLYLSQNNPRSVTRSAKPKLTLTALDLIADRTLWTRDLGEIAARERKPPTTIAILVRTEGLSPTHPCRESRQLTSGPAKLSLRLNNS